MHKNTLLSPSTQAAIIQQSALLRMYQIIGDPERGIAPLLPISRTSFLNGVASGRYPKKIKHGRSSFWKASEIFECLAKIEGGQ
uniref:helix-turn-helix transcriptional regulator n=1 Tax=Crenothrix polyspora TaxID=360316 RepID=UPI00211B1CEB|nr:AlpA family transcriptional regulator [Crenothrix polyspora]